MNHNYSFATNNLILNPMDLKGSEAYRRLRNRDDNRVYFFDSSVVSKEQQEKWFSSYLKKDNDFMFTIFRSEEPVFIGAVGIYNINCFDKTAEIGRIIIDRTIAGGNGYGSEVIDGIARFTHKTLNIDEVYAHIYNSNTASIKSFLNAGFLQIWSDGNVDADNIIKVSRKLL